MTEFGSRPCYWVVICKNSWFLHRKNPMFGHTIPLAETDFYSSPPALAGSFKVRCDDCGKEYIYHPEELFRAELEPLVPILTHPLFR